MSAVDEVLEAQAKADEADSAASELASRIRNGDQSVTAEALLKQRSLVEFLRLKVDGLRARHAESIAADRVKTIRSLKVEIAKRSKDSSGDLTLAFAAAEDAISVFVKAAEARTADVAGWMLRLRELGVETNVPFEGVTIGLTGQLQVDGQFVDGVQGGVYLNQILRSTLGEEGQIVPRGDGWRRTAAFEQLEAIGKVNQ